MHGKDEKCIESNRNLKGMGWLGNLEIDGGIKLKWIQKYGVYSIHMVQFAVPMVVSCDHGNENCLP
jgi:hypothetical protein